MGKDNFLDLAASYVQKAHGHKVAGYTFRRWLSSVADGLRLGLEKRGDLGNWADGVAGKGQKRTSEPMPVHYSSMRLESCVHSDLMSCAYPKLMQTISCTSCATMMKSGNQINTSSSSLSCDSKHG